MTLKEYYGKDFYDQQLPSDFVTHCKDQTIPISVVGNGGSLQQLKSSDISTINDTRLFRCNWAFNDPNKIKKQYAIYFAQAFNGTHEQKFTETCKAANNRKQFIYYRFQDKVVYNYNLMNTFLDEDGEPVWPTSGIQMLIQAAYIIPTPEIHVAGMDMYTYKRDKKHMSKKEMLSYLKKYGKTFSDSPTNSAGLGFVKRNLTYIKPDKFVNTVKLKKHVYHHAEVDMLVLFNIFTHCILTNREILFHGCEFMKSIYNICGENISTLKEYFTIKQDTFNQIPSLSKSYNAWRLVNKTMNVMLPD